MQTVRAYEGNGVAAQPAGGGLCSLTGTGYDFIIKWYDFPGRSIFFIFWYGDASIISQIWNHMEKSIF
jgi:hypothetical protein